VRAGAKAQTDRGALRGAEAPLFHVTSGIPFRPLLQRGSRHFRHSVDRGYDGAGITSGMVCRAVTNGLVTFGALEGVFRHESLVR